MTPTPVFAGYSVTHKKKVQDRPDDVAPLMLDRPPFGGREPSIPDVTRVENAPFKDVPVVVESAAAAGGSVTYAAAH